MGTSTPPALADLREWLGMPTGDDTVLTAALEAALAGKDSVAEGVLNTQSAKALADKVGVEMPIVAAVGALLDGSATVEAVISNLLARPLKPESW